MADTTALAESSQAFFCAIGDYLGVQRTNKIFDIEKYPIYEDFWNQIIGETVLYFECDSMLCFNSEHKVEDFEHFDYIGGYWGDSFHEKSVDEVYERVMNGGVSFRKKSYMLDIIKNQLKPYLERGGNPCEDYFVSELLNKINGFMNCQADTPFKNYL